ncbi:S1C family serine protease [Leptothrix discophora]|uniref:Trypsin-like peptidase domain-containing protein n=1 Tax=Leptothrix discophora TaxID=89 RepID=A0ABT9G4Y4_LEPDI|nr:trypsin-like peptidase domain-containing protein [Leptothrix discophora]MDP4301552.1 trypsin-like peptidase domain-containing protein [Leptothrix discophora]
MRRLWLTFSQAVTVAVAVVFVLATFKPDWLPSGTSPGTSSGAAAPSLPGALPQALPASANLPALAAEAGADAAVQGSPNSFARAARRAAPSVVSVVTTGGSRQVDEEPAPQGTEPWFRRFFGDKGNPAVPSTGMGSAVIVSADGYLLTNNHVIEGAGRIEVVLNDGRRLQARTVGADPESDLAVLKVDAEGLPMVSFGQSDVLQVGDAVLAIGNPFNVGQTVTSGIVSALGRSGLGLNTFESFIQTDAAINPGNSGGALVDVEGRLLGINTAIYSRSGGSMGIGFAIPVATARQVMDGLIRNGVVTRGWIGVQPRDLTPELAQSIQIAEDTRGVLIVGVLDDGPAAQAGVRPGDVVQQVGGHVVASTAQLLNEVAALPPQSRANLRLLRAGREIDVQVKVAQRPRQRPSATDGK